MKLLQVNLCKTVSLINEGYRFQLKTLSMLYILYVCLHTSVIYIELENNVYIIDVILSALWVTFDIIKLVYIIHLYRILTIQVIVYASFLSNSVILLIKFCFYSISEETYSTTCIGIGKKKRLKVLAVKVVKILMSLNNLFLINNNFNPYNHYI